MKNNSVKGVGTHNEHHKEQHQKSKRRSIGNNTMRSNARGM
jgi:hypothetical protein